MKSKIKILAPAGSFESLTSAINAGTDEIYFGIGELNMRASAAVNFKISDLKKISNIRHKNNVKVYVTLNTIVYDQELNQIKKILQEIKKQKIDGIIASDLAIIKTAYDMGISVHISTQMSISNIESVRFFSQFADRIVLARELDLEQIKFITNQIKKQKIYGPNKKLVEIEVFAHGAMCVGISGRCQMSLYHYNLSANRGKCVQICRRRYKVTDLDTDKELILNDKSIMSRSDLCTIGMLDKLVDSGINVLKIEGRGRGPEYVDTVIKTYRKALNDIENKTFSKNKIEEYLRDLKTVFNRGFSTGYYLGKKQEEWATGENNQATEKKFLVGKIDHFYPKISVVSVKLNPNETIKNGDTFLITGPTTGIIRGIVKNLQFDSHSYTFPISSKSRINDKFFIMKKSE